MALTKHGLQETLFYKDFSEFVIGSTLTFKSKPDEKIELIFDAYDYSDDGKISKAEILSILQAISGLHPDLQLSKMDLENKVSMIFKKLDANNDGEITKHEFIEGVTKDQDLMELVNFKQTGQMF
jgi:guanylate cyclase activator 1